MSMKNYLNETDVITSIRLQLRHPSGTGKVWVVVEGDTDFKLFRKLINGKNTIIEISHGGLGNLQRSVLVLLIETKRIIGIRDADFLHLENQQETSENIFITDFHDAEMMMISCDAVFSAVISEYLPNETQSGQLRMHLLKSISFLGGIRWLNESENLVLNFRKLGFGSFYDGKTASLDANKCLNEVLKRSPNKKNKITKHDVALKIQRVTDFYNLCNGHDFHKALSLYISSVSVKGVKDLEIGKIFRVAYRNEDFQKSNLYKQLLQWSENQSIELFNN